MTYIYHPKSDFQDSSPTLGTGKHRAGEFVGEDPGPGPGPGPVEAKERRGKSLFHHNCGVIASFT